MVEWLDSWIVGWKDSRGEFIRPKCQTKGGDNMEKLDGKMVKWLGLTCCLLLVTCSTTFALFGGPGAHADFGSMPKFISLQQGTTAAAWDNVGNVFVSSPMIAAGDGTWYIKANLFPGAEYNFVFRSTTGATPPTGLTANATYRDCPRTSGDDTAFFVARDSAAVTATRIPGAAQFKNVGPTGSDSRRFFVVPQDTGYTVSSPSGVWIYNNWSSSPVVTLSAGTLSASSLGIKIGAHSTWGTSEEYKAIDVYCGGIWYLYRATDLGGTYSLIASSTAANLGSLMTFTNEGLTTGTTYYYVAVASDAYRGAMNTLAADGCLTRLLADGTIDASGKTPAVAGYDTYGRPAAAIPVYFKVEAPDWDYIEKNDYIVYLTPVGVDGRVWPWKMPGKVIRVYLPHPHEKT